ncbi:MAG: MarR family transcriptional regulator [Atopobiaceae bacterium]|nr:MarR family transcriptional regulator [Atopobiaceae bacterium]
MEVREFISVRRAYNLIRQEVPSSSRLAFEEFAVLAHLSTQEHPLKTSDLAVYQNVLRPTMTHRTNHLAKLGLIERTIGESDRRNVCCALSDAGREVLFSLAKRACSKIHVGQSLSRITADRLVKYADAMGGIYLTASDLILLALCVEKEGCTVGSLVSTLGMLQPTVSMSVSNLVEQGLAQRRSTDRGNSNVVTLTREGSAAANSIKDSIEQVIVRRRRRS